MSRPYSAIHAFAYPIVSSFFRPRDLKKIECSKCKNDGRSTVLYYWDIIKDGWSGRLEHNKVYKTRNYEVYNFCRGCNVFLTIKIEVFNKLQRESEEKLSWETRQRETEARKKTNQKNKQKKREFSEPRSCRSCLKADCIEIKYWDKIARCYAKEKNPKLSSDTYGIAHYCHRCHEFNWVNEQEHYLECMDDSDSFKDKDLGNSKDLDNLNDFNDHYFEDDFLTDEDHLSLYEECDIWGLGMGGGYGGGLRSYEDSRSTGKKYKALLPKEMMDRIKKEGR